MFAIHKLRKKHGCKVKCQEQNNRFAALGWLVADLKVMHLLIKNDGVLHGGHLLIVVNVSRCVNHSVCC